MRRRTAVTAVLLAFSLSAGACSSGGPHRRATSAPSAVASSTPAAPSILAPTTAPRTSASVSATTPRPPNPAPRRASKASSTDPATSARTRLPLGFTTGNASQVITVIAPSTSSTTATLQAWQRSGNAWSSIGPAVPAHLGSAGMSTHASESSTATPIGSFTLTQAFGRDSDPGTALPYLRTNPQDWWISQPGSLYNTHQRCSSGCSFTRGDPNEHLYYETPYYDYAVVIDYNTADAPGGVVQGKGSAFFLHVTVGQPTQGCVSIPADQIVRLLRWLTPTEHPRILLGTV